MSPQVVHALKQMGIMIVLAVLAVIGTDGVGLVHVLQEAGISPLWIGLVPAALAAIVRWVEGIRDANREKQGKIVPADVGYDYIKTQAEASPAYEYPLMAENNKDVLV